MSDTEPTSTVEFDCVAVHTGNHLTLNFVAPEGKFYIRYWFNKHSYAVPDFGPLFRYADHIDLAIQRASDRGKSEPLTLRDQLIEKYNLRTIAIMHL